MVAVSATKGVIFRVELKVRSLFLVKSKYLTGLSSLLVHLGLLRILR